MSTPIPVHWPRGGSKSNRIVACPGSVHQEARYPAEPSGPAAIDGTHTHTLLEHSLNNTAPPTEYVGDTLDDHEGEFVIDVDRAKRAAVAYDYVMQRMGELPEAELHIEQFVDAGGTYNIPGWGGSTDVAIVDRKARVLEVIDYKDGARAVSADTWQMVTYAIGMMNKYPTDPFDEIRTTIVQPKVYADPQTHIYTPHTFAERVTTLVRAMKESLKPEARLETGDHCKWCAGAKPGRCPEFNRRATVSINEAFANVPAPAAAQSVAPPLAIPTVTESQLTNEQLAQVLDAAPLVREWLKEAELEAERRAMSGQTIPGYKPVRGKTMRQWTKDALDQLSKMRVKRHVYTKEVLHTPKQVTESEEFKALSDKQREKIEALIIKPEGPLKLVPLSDPRTALTFNPEEVFADVEVPQVEAPAPEAPRLTTPPSFL